MFLVVCGWMQVMRACSLPWHQLCLQRKNRKVLKRKKKRRLKERRFPEREIEGL